METGNKSVLIGVAESVTGFLAMLYKGRYSALKIGLDKEQPE